MKKLFKFLRAILIIVLMILLLAFGSLLGVFALDRNFPKDIFVLNYALAYEKGDDNSVDVWLVQKLDDKSPNSKGDSTLCYLDKTYTAAQYIPLDTGERIFLDSKDLTRTLEVDDAQIVGKILLSWSFGARK